MRYRHGWLRWYSLLTACTTGRVESQISRDQAIDIARQEVTFSCALELVHVIAREFSRVEMRKQVEESDGAESARRATRPAAERTRKGAVFGPA